MEPVHRAHSEWMFRGIAHHMSKCRECSAKTVASLYVNCWRKSAFFFGNIGLCVPEPISEYVGRNIQSRFFRAVCLDLGSRLLASIKDNRGTGKRRASILPHILTISQHRQIKFLQFWAAVFGASLEDHNKRFTRNDLKNLREWSVKCVVVGGQATRQLPTA